MAIWDKLSTDGAVDDRRGMGGAIAGGGGLITLIIVLALNFLGLNIDPATVDSVISSANEMRGTQASQQEQPPEFRGDDSYEVFARKVLGSTDDLWTGIFAEAGKTYQKPTLVLFREATRSGCGVATSAVGPHFCPQDNTIYLDETFFDELTNRYGADAGDVAQAYVIAHEVAHSVQLQLGHFDAGTAGTSQHDSIETELQADCFAGVWAYSVRQIFDSPTEIQEAQSAAAAVGDDRIQSRSGGGVDQETWTHGSSQQRVNALNIGYTTGSPSQCKNLQR